MKENTATDSFRKRVYDAVMAVPAGRVSTYGDIAAAAGCPKGARAVGNALHCNTDPKEIPCFRIVDSKGNLSENYRFGGAESQKLRLEKDGVEVNNYTVDLRKYRYFGK